MKKLFALLIALLMMPGMSLAENLPEGQDDHTLVIAVYNPGIADPRLEYAFLNRWPDGKIVYVEYKSYSDSSLQMLTGRFPDLLMLSEGELPRYDKVGLIEDLYEHAFPNGYPGTLAEQARKLMERDGRMVGISTSCAYQCWEINPSTARSLGLDIPAEGWTEQDFIAQYLDGYTGDTNGDGVLDIWLMDSGSAGGEEEGSFIINKWIPMGMEDAVIRHMENPDYFLTDDFLAELEVGKRVYQSDAILTHMDENFRILSMDGQPRRFLFDYLSTSPGPYRQEKASAFLAAQIPAPAFCSGEPNQRASMDYYVLMRGAPHHDLAIEVMRMMASEEYQSIYDDTLPTRGIRSFGAKEPTLQLVPNGTIYQYSEVFYSEDYHANVRVVDASSPLSVAFSELTPSPETWQAHLDMLERLGSPFYDNHLFLEIKCNVFHPALREYFADNMTAEEVARLLYQRVRIAVYE